MVIKLHKSIPIYLSDSKQFIIFTIATLLKSPTDVKIFNLLLHVMYLSILKRSNIKYLINILKLTYILI